ncbi:MAG TPA: hypothetical protein VG102_01070 [Candidatus Paceibacterota bacterium]|jgi:hypothetical protein|nr:hypothetical protein [Candidatus Paceibacterota bacterium]
MNEEQAKQRLREFLQNRELTFSIRTYDSTGEWIAECNEIPGIITGGIGDYTERDQLMRDAIITAASVKGDFGYLLEFKGYKVPTGFFGFTSKPETALYVVPS